MMENKAYTFGWLAILAILFTYEVYALVWGHGKDWPLTWAVVKYAPWWITMPFLTWLWFHFASRYWRGEAYIKLISGGK